MTTTRYDTGTGLPPEWLPRFPGATLLAVPTYYREPIEQTGKFRVQAPAAAEEIHAFYRSALVSLGFEIDLDSEIPFSAASGVPMGMFSAALGGRKVSVLVVVEPGKDAASTSVAYSEVLAAE